MDQSEYISKTKINLKEIKSKCIEISEDHYDSVYFYYQTYVNFFWEYDFHINDQSALLYTTRYAYDELDGGPFFDCFFKYIWLCKFKIEMLNRDDEVNLIYIESETYSQEPEFVFDFKDDKQYSKKELTYIQDFIDCSLDNTTGEEISDYFKNLTISDENVKEMIKKKMLND